MGYWRDDTRTRMGRLLAGHPEPRASDQSTSMLPQSPLNLSFGSPQILKHTQQILNNNKHNGLVWLIHSLGNW